MEKKYDKFFLEHQSELGGVKKKVNTMIVQKKTKREILSTWLVYFTIAGIILGSSFGYLRYKANCDKMENVKIEKMLEKILSK
jgi:hypothetical protein